MARFPQCAGELLGYRRGEGVRLTAFFEESEDWALDPPEWT